jgi:hypothetical protein
MLAEDLAWIAEATGARAARRGARIQSLWAGCGELFRVHLDGGPCATAVVKWARPPTASDDVGDARKRRSYEVETAWYQGPAARCGEGCRVARLLGGRAEAGEWILVLEDLDAAGFGARRRHIEGRALDACIRWLAIFHARFLGASPEGLWPTGTYWHLATRREELEALGDPALVESARRLDAQLEGCAFKTLVHGDAKEANFCFDATGAAVAAVDFQYVGGGCGVRDLAYLLHGRDGAPAGSIDAYFAYLREALSRSSPDVDAGALEAEWRALYPVAKADFERFLAGWMRDRRR